MIAAPGAEPRDLAPSPGGALLSGVRGEPGDVGSAITEPAAERDLSSSFVPPTAPDFSTVVMPPAGPEHLSVFMPPEAPWTPSIISGPTTSSAMDIYSTSVIDQQAFVACCGPNSAPINFSGSWVAQIFTAGFTGGLTQVSLNATGSGPLTVRILSIDGSGNPATDLASGSAPSQLGGSQWTDVRLTTIVPLTAGTRYAIAWPNSAYVIASNNWQYANGYMRVLQFGWTGIAPNWSANFRTWMASGPQVTPTSYDFGRVAVGASATATFSVTNYSNTTATFAPAVAGPNASDFTVAGCASAAPGASCSFTVTFVPSDVTGRSATIDLHALPTAADNVSVSGYGVGIADLVVSIVGTPNPVNTGDTLTYNVSVLNKGPYRSTNAVLTDTLPGGVTFVSAAGSLPGNGAWTPTGAMLTPRRAPTATVLPNGKVLVTGGSAASGSSVLTSAELYDPVAGTWSPTGSMATPRIAHTATLLKNGNVLITGGIRSFNYGDVTPTAELYDPLTGVFAPTGNSIYGREGASATLLQNGKVLIVGGDAYTCSCPPQTNSAELYDPATGVFSRTGSLIGEHRAAAVLLPNGQVLVAGSSGSPQQFMPISETYDPNTGIWTRTGDLNVPRGGHAMVLLPTGKVLLAGGSSVGISAAAELYDPATRTWTPTASMGTPRWVFGAESQSDLTVLANGTVLAEGGQIDDPGNATVLTEIYDPSVGSWTPTAPMSRPRAYHRTVLLNDGRALVLGGMVGGVTLSSAEIYTVLTRGSCSGPVSGQVTCALGDIQPNADLKVTIKVKPTAAGTLTNEAVVVSDQPGPNTADDRATVNTTALVPHATQISGVASGPGGFVGGVFVRIDTTGGVVVSSGTTDANGYYALAVPDGNYIVVFYPPRSAHLAMQVYDQKVSTASPTTVSVNGADVTGINAHLIPAYPVSGTITDAVGAPMQGVQVWSYLGTPGVCCYFIRDDVTDAQGHYSIDLASGYSYKLQFAPFLPTEQWWGVHNNPSNSILTGWTSADAFEVSSTSSSCSGLVVSLFNNWDGGLVANNGTPPMFPIASPYCITEMDDYHWNPTSTNAPQGATPGTMGLSGPVTLGPVQATGTNPQNLNAAPYVNWSIYPTLGTWIAPAGSYTCLDSDHGTWSQDFGSGFKGFCKVFGVPYVTTTTTGHPNTNAQLNTNPVISGRVIDAATGGPIQGVSVNANAASTPPDQCCPPPAGGATTDASGNYAFQVPPGTYRVSFNAGGAPYVSRWRNNTPAGAGSFQSATDVTVGPSATLNQTLSGGILVQGQVRGGPSNAMQPNVGVNADPIDGSDNGGSAGTNSDGMYFLRVLPGLYTLRFHPNDPVTTLVDQYWNDQLTNDTATSLDLRTQPTIHFDATLHTGVVLSGTVRTSTAQGIANVDVNVHLGGPGSVCRWNSCPSLNARTNSTGQYRVVVKPGLYRPHFHAPFGSVFVSRMYDNTAGFDQSADLDISADRTLDMTLASGIVVSGRVTNAAAAGLPSIGVDLQPADGSFGFGEGARSDGRFSFAVPDGRYRIHYHPNDPSSPYLDQYWNNVQSIAAATIVTLSPTTPVTTYNAILGTGWAITGTVTDSAVPHTPIANVWVQAFAASCANPWPDCTQYRASQRTDSSGAYHLVVPAGDWKLQFNPGMGSFYVQAWYGGGNDFNIATPVHVGPDAVVNMTLSLGLRLQGHVSSPTSPGVAGVGINPFDPRSGCCGFVGGGGTNSNGDFSFAVPAGTYYVRFRADQVLPLVQQWWNGSAIGSLTRSGGITVTGVAGQSIDGLNATMQPGFVISGRVTDAATMLPINDVNVGASIGGPGSDSTAGDGRTNTSGDYRFAVPVGTYRIAFDGSSTDHLFTWYTGAAGGSNDFNAAAPAAVSADKPGIDMIMTKGIRVTGRVTSGGLGVANVCACFQRVDQPGGNGAGTGLDGQYSALLAPGRYRLQFSPNDPSSRLVSQYWQTKATQAAADIIDLTAAPMRTFDADLVPGFLVTGTITQTGTTTALAGIQLNAINAACGQWGPMCEQYWARALSDGSGSYRIALPAGSWKLYFSPQDPRTMPYVASFYGSRDFQTATAVLVSADTAVNMSLDRGNVIRGTVTDSAGHVQPQIGVSVFPADQNGGGFGGRTFQDGTYAVVVPPGLYKIRFEPNDPLSPLVPQYWNSKNTVTLADVVDATSQPAGTFDASLASGFAITGTITEAATPTTILGVGVTAIDASCGQWGPSCAQFWSRGQSDGAGHYRLVVPAGNWKLWFQAPQGSPYLSQFRGGGQDIAQAQGLPVAADTIVDQTLARGVFLSGTVTDGVRGVPNVGVNVQTPGQKGGGFGIGQTDANGHYGGAVAPGRYVLSFHPNDPATRLVAQSWNNKAANGLADVIDLTVATPVTVHDATLATGNVISGTVTGAVSHLPVSNVFVGASDSGCGPTTPFLSCPNYPSQSNTRSDGSYRIVVPNGSWIISFFPDQSSLYLSGNTGGAVVISTDRQIDIALQLGMRLTGHLSSSSLGTGIPGVGVSPFDATKPCCAQVRGARANANGDYTVVVPAGSYKIQFSPPPPFFRQYFGGALTFATAYVVTGAPGDTVTTHMTLQSGYVVSGTVTDASTQLPIQNASVWADPSPCCGAPGEQPPGGANTDANGAYSFALPAGTYIVNFQAFDQGYVRRSWTGSPGGTPNGGQATAIVVGPAKPGIDMALPHGFLITGHAFGPDGVTPAANVQVTAVDAGQVFNNLAGARTDASGFYQMLVVVGSYKMKFQPPAPLVMQYWQGAAGFDTATPVAVTNANVVGIDALLQSGFTFSGHVTDAGTGLPLAGVNVNVQFSARRAEPAGFTRTAADGSYSVAVAAGSYRIGFNGIGLGYVSRFWTGSPGGVSRFLDAPDIIVGPDRPNTDIALPVGYSITGHVTAADGRHPANVTVFPVDATLPCCTVAGNGWITDPNTDGTFRLFAAAGTYKIQVMPNNGPTTSYLPQFWNGSRDFAGGTIVTVTNAAVGGIEVLLENGVRLTGQVVDSVTGIGIGGLTVTAYRGAATDLCVPCVQETTTQTAADGTYTLFVHRMATYKLSIGGDSYLGQWYDNKPDFTTATPVVVQELDVPLNQIRLTKGVAVSGTVTATAATSLSAITTQSLVGLAGIRVRAFHAGATAQGTIADVFANVITGAGGQYSFIAPAGPFKLLFTSTTGLSYAATWSGGGRDALSAQTLQAIVGTPVVQHMVMTPGFPISGTFRDATTGAAITSPAIARLLLANRGNTEESVVDFESIDATGAYWIVAIGGAFTNYKLQFRPLFNLTDTAPYLTQYWNGKPSYDTADPFTVLAADPTKNALLTVGVPVRGSLKDRATGAGIAGAVIEAYDARGALRAVRLSVADGTFAMVAPRGGVRFRFVAPGYAPVWWKDAFTTDGATTVDTTAATIPSLDQLLDRETTDLAVHIVGPDKVGVVTPFDSIVTVQNKGNVPSSGRLSHGLSTGLRFVAVTASQGACTGLDSSTGTCDTGTIPPGGMATFTFRTSAPLPGTFTQTATIATAAFDTNPENNTDTKTTLVPADGVVTGITQCGTTLVPNATISIGAGSVLLAVVHSGADGAFAFSLAPDRIYTVFYRGTVGGVSIVCGVRLHTALKGVTTIVPPPLFPDLHNHSYTTATTLKSGTEQIDFLTRPRISDWYVVNVRQGQRITVDVYGTPADLTLALYGDILAAKNPPSLTTTDTRLYGVAIAPGADTAIAPGADTALAPGADTALAPGADTALAPGADTALAPGADTALAPGADTALAPGADTALAPGADTALAPGADTALAPGADTALAPGADTAIAPGADTALANGDYSTEVRTSLLAISANRGAGVPERIVRQTFDHAGNYYIRVLGQSSTSSFAVKATVEDSECVGVALQKFAPAWPGGRPLTTPKTIILMNSDALRKADGTPLSATELSSFMALVQQFAQRREVGGAIVDLALDTGFMQNMTQWAGAASCPAAANVASEVIRDMIGEYRKANPVALEYVVILGPHTGVPHRLEPDRAMAGSESQYAPPVDNSSRSEAALRRGKVETDDYYGALQPITRAGEQLYVPDLAVGRLVETYEDIVGGLSAYLETTDGVIDLKPVTGQPAPRSLVTSYDFLAKLGDVQKADLLASGMTVDQLQSPMGVKPTDPLAWTADDLRRLLLGPDHYGVIGLNAHFSASTAWAANLGTLSVAELAAITDGRYKHTLVLSNGCHTGYVVVAGDAIPGLTQKVDWAQTFVRQGANLIAGTGYMYGGVQVLNFDQVILADAMARLRAGTGPVAIGKALAGAKHDYVNAYPSQLDATDLKALREVTLYGLPMASYDFGNRTPAPIPQIIQPRQLHDGLAVTEIRAGASEVASDAPGLSTRPYALKRTDVTLPVVGGGSAVESYYDADGKTTALANTPVLPKTTINVETSGATAMGAVLDSADLTRLPNWRPFTDITATDAGGTYPSFVTSAPYPKLPYSLSLLAGQSLVLNQFQYRSDGQAVTGTGTRYDHMTLRVYTTTATGAAGVAAPPSLSSTRLVANGTAVRVIAVVAGATDVEDVFATYTATAGDAANHFRSIRLVRGPNLSTTRAFVREFIGDIETGSVDALSTYRVFLQAVGSNGLVSVALNNGELFRVPPSIVAIAPALAPPSDTAITLELSGPTGTPPATPSVPFGGTIGARAVLTDAGTGTPVAGRPIVFSLGSHATPVLTDAAGQATAQFVVTDAPGSEQVKVAFLGDPSFAGNGRVVDVTVIRAPSVLTAETATIEYSDGAPIGTLTAGAKRLALVPVVVTIGTQSIPTLTDPYGRVQLNTRDFALAQGTYTVTLEYPGSPTYAPVTASTSVTIAREHSTVAFPVAPSSKGRDVSVTTKITQQADGSAGDLTLASVEYLLTLGSTAMKATVPSPADGTTSVTLTVPADGRYRVQGTVSGDYFTSPAAVTDVIVDTQPPTTTAVLAPAANAKGWNKADTTVKLTSVDNGLAGVKEIHYRLSGAQAGAETVVTADIASITVSTEGTTTVTFWAIDNFGNTEAVKAQVVRLSKHAGTSTASPSASPNVNGWNNGDVTVTLTATSPVVDDTVTIAYNLDGAGWQPYATPLVISAEGVHTLLYRSTDLADNVEADRTLVVRIDKTAPEAYLRFDPTAYDFAVFGRDSLSGTGSDALKATSVRPVKWTDGKEGFDEGDDGVTELRTYVVRDRADNLTTLLVLVKKEGGQVAAVITGITYETPGTGGRRVVTPVWNVLHVTWNAEGGLVNELNQSFALFESKALRQHVSAEWTAETNTTTIRIKLPKPETKIVLAGQILLRIATSGGALTFEY